jgi:hypothetical protein
MKRIIISIGLGVGLLTISGCKENVKPHQDAAGGGDVYCIYKVTAARGGGAIPVNGQLCILCPPADANKTCKTTKTIVVAEGIEYDLVAVGATCTTCPAPVVTAARTYEKSDR